MRAKIALKPLKRGYNNQEQLGSPPSYETIASGSTREDKHRQRAIRLVAQHEYISEWFPGVEDPPTVQDIVSFSKGHDLPARSQKYVCDTLDDYRAVMTYFDFLVDQVGLRHAAGAENCESWFLTLRISSEGTKRVVDFANTVSSSSMIHWRIT